MRSETCGESMVIIENMPVKEMPKDMVSMRVNRPKRADWQQKVASVEIIAENLFIFRWSMHLVSDVNKTFFCQDQDQDSGSQDQDQDQDLHIFFKTKTKTKTF